MKLTYFLVTGFITCVSAFSNASQAFKQYTIEADGIKANFIEYGARITHLYVKDRNNVDRDVVLGYDSGQEYIKDSETVHTYFGAIVGRYANRIKNGTFSIDGVTSHIPENENGGKDTLHGGTIGYDQRNWTVVTHNETSVTFSLLDTGFEGFPGSVITYATYTLTGKNKNNTNPKLTSRIVSLALDNPTPIMLANHIYWNLNAFLTPDHTILNDTLEIPFGNRYIKIDNIEVPTGEIGVVEGTPLDFTKAKTIGSRINETKNACGYGCVGYDNAFIIDRPRYAAPESTDLTLLSLASDTTGIRLDVKTNQRSFQIYSCNGLNGTIPVKSSQQYTRNTTTIPKYGCLVIETQQWIDGINYPEWGQLEYQIYRPDTQPAVNYAEYEFSTF